MKPLPLLFLSVLSFASLGFGEEWRVVKSEHFIVQHVRDREQAEAMAREAERAYARIARELGFTRFDRFWLWDRRVRIVVYPSRDAFTRATGSPAWAMGKASYKTREIATFSGSEGFPASVLPHELAHLIFRDFIGFDGSAPLWLDEGVAQWAENADPSLAHRAAAQLLADRRLIPLDTLTRMKPQAGGHREATVFYIEAASVVGFLLERYGSDRFQKFCRQLRDGKPLEDALRFTYPDPLRTIMGLERAWINYLEGHR